MKPTDKCSFSTIILSLRPSVKPGSSTIKCTIWPTLNSTSNSCRRFATNIWVTSYPPVLDLDNILWGGIGGEDGLEGIKLGPTTEGRPFYELQKYILALHNRGVILAINSKNNKADAIEVLQKHPYSILKEEHFASIQINWDDKIANMKKVADEINIGLDSLVFFDDDPTNREIIKSALPQVTVVETPEDPALYLETIMSIKLFNQFSITEEDKKKGKMFATELKNSTSDIGKYLTELGIKVTFAPANQFNLPRIAQLVQKTNQFNTTTIRYTEEQLGKMSKDKNFWTLCLQVEDRFGDSGITGVAIVDKKDPQHWRLDSLLLSCRILGKEIENAFLAYILSAAKKAGVERLSGDFIATKKNAVSGEFFKQTGFERLGNKNGVEKWTRKISQKFTSPAFIKVSTKK
ncbi:MAG: HAD-IIIC family phosphatase [Candidatus Taylorbacteria bacterium]|nr:HAD-IIIC family phosphatase [Candidatus Taylorbacteria bacterium]